MKSLLPESVVAIDGKTLRGSKSLTKCQKALHIMNAWSCANQVCLGQLSVDDKSNEIPAVPELIKLLCLEGVIQQYVKTGIVTAKPARHNGFQSRYTDADIRLLAQMDERHGQPSGHILKKLCEQAYQRFGESQYQRLATLSVSHLYNLRQSTTYQRQRCTLTKTQSKSIPIGQRRKPTPNNQPGYIRIDSVHQGDQDKRKGVYHINAVDEVTQFQVIVTVERISEAFMKPALITLLATFPFTIKGFHADNGSEYINYTVAELLEKCQIEFTKSHPRQSNDNGLVESKKP